MKIENFIGIWDSIEIPDYISNDKRTIRLTIQPTLIATLWIMDDVPDNSIILAEGEISMTEFAKGNFTLIIKGIACDDRYLKLNSQIHADQKPRLIQIDIHEYGKRFFQEGVNTINFNK